MDWDVVDFAVFGAMLLGAGAVYRLTSRRSGSWSYRFGVGVALAAAFLLLWVNGAVGIIGDEGNDANVMFFGVLAVAIAGSAFARFKPQGMARAFIATALAQVLVAVVALSAELGSGGPIWPRDVLFLTVFFTAMWLLSARLFQIAARRRYEEL